MVPSRIYHVGIVVSDLQKAMGELTSLASLSWGNPQVYTGLMTMQGTQLRFEQTFAISLDGPPHIELLGQLDGTVWNRTGLHHLGIWSDNVDEDCSLVQTRGCALESISVSAQDERTSGRYFGVPALDSRLEIVSREISEPRLERYLAGGSY